MSAHCRTRQGHQFVGTLTWIDIQRNYLSDSDYIEIVDYMDDGTGDCCWFSRKK